jgi:shikimate kinase / 3-dehydroquinate synthase
MRRPLLLSGFMATGKSTVGRRIGELCGVGFEDLDARIEARAGATVAEIFSRHGEPEFRALERAELDAVLADPSPRVVALGGGALVSRDARLTALERAIVVTLSAPAETIAARTAGDTSRPLLSPRRLPELLEQRRGAYAEAHGVIDTSDGQVDRHARAAISIWQRDPIAVAAGTRSYAVDVGLGIAAQRLSELGRGATGVLLVSDENVAPLHAARLDRAFSALGVAPSRVLLAPGEPSKSIGGLQLLWRACLSSGIDRKGIVVALGGGVVSDLAGLCAATWMRGVGWVALPSTLLAMVDASVGGKTGIDLDAAKNAIGAFWQPTGVACDTALLATEPERGFRSALAEVVKTALIGDPELYALLERRPREVLARDPAALLEVVRRSVAVKAGVVSRDERESGLRAVLNLGHSVGHALEARGDFSVLSHGEAVSLGLVAAMRVGALLGVTPGELASRTESLLASLGLPVSLAAQPIDEALEKIVFDKKRTGQSLRFVVARRIGHVTYIDLPVQELANHVRRAALQ